MRRFFQSNRIIDSHDILTYHFKEQCKLLRKIHTTMPNARSLHDQPSVRVKANGAIVLNQSYHTSMSLDWTPAIISEHHYFQEDAAIDQEILDGESDVQPSFLSAAPVRRPFSH